MEWIDRLNEAVNYIEKNITSEIEVYLNADPNNAQYEVWIPIVSKK